VTLFSYAQQTAYAEAQRLHPSDYIIKGGHCQEFARRDVNAPAYAASALDAALKVPSAHRFDLAHARPGMMGFAAYRDSNGHLRQYGHAFKLAEHGYVYSTDLPTHGRLGKVPLSLITTSAGWNMPLLWFSDWTPFGIIPTLAVSAPAHVNIIDLSMIQAAAKTDPNSKQGHTTYAHGVIIVEVALVKLGYLANNAYAKDGSFGSLTRTAYAEWQKACKSPYHDGIPRSADLVALGKKYGFKVVA
jgi:hypothetical protein